METGWIRNDDAVAAYTEQLTQSYGSASFGDRNPSLKGHWNKLVARGQTAVLAQSFEALLHGGTNLPAEFQRRGTCVSRGTFRAIQDAYYYELARHLVAGRKALLAFETIYAGSRVNIGRGQLGNGDGSCGAWAAEWVATCGVLERRRYGDFDLTNPNEGLAVELGKPRAGVPQVLIDAGQGHLVAAHRAYNVNELADGVSAGYFAAYCSDLIWGNRNADGIAVPESNSGHCEEVAGVALDRRGQLIFVRQQSWGDLPGGPNVLQTAQGPITLRQGSYGARAEDMQRGLDRGGECWMFKLLSSFR